MFRLFLGSIVVLYALVSFGQTPDQIQAVVTAANNLVSTYNADQAAQQQVTAAQAAVTSATQAQQQTGAAFSAAETALIIAVQALPQPVQAALRKALDGRRAAAIIDVPVTATIIAARRKCSGPGCAAATLYRKHPLRPWLNK